MPIKKQTVKQAKKSTTIRAKVAEPEKMVSFWRAIVNFFGQYFKFNGTSTRAEFWWGTLFLIICIFVISIVTTIIIKPMQPVTVEQEVALVYPVVLFCIAMIVGWYALMARRLHDIGVTAKLLWVCVIFRIYSFLIPNILPGSFVVVCLFWIWTIILFILFMFPSKTKNNPYRK